MEQQHSEQSDSSAKELVRVLALDPAESEKHRQWLTERTRNETASHREWIEGVMEKDRAVQRKILAELRGIRRLLEREGSSS